MKSREIYAKGDRVTCIPNSRHFRDVAIESECIPSSRHFGKDRK